MFCHSGAMFPKFLDVWPCFWDWLCAISWEYCYCISLLAALQPQYRQGSSLGLWSWRTSICHPGLKSSSGFHCLHEDHGLIPSHPWPNLKQLLHSRYDLLIRAVVMWPGESSVNVLSVMVRLCLDGFQILPSPQVDWIYFNGLPLVIDGPTWVSKRAGGSLPGFCFTVLQRLWLWLRTRERLKP